TSFEEEPIEIGTGITGTELEFLEQCIDSCGNLINTYQFNDVTGIISGTDFIPVKELITGEFLQSFTPRFNCSFKLTDSSPSCGYIEDPDYISEFAFDGISYLRPIDSKDFTEIAGFTSSEM